MKASCSRLGRLTGIALVMGLMTAVAAAWLCVVFPGAGQPLVMGPGPAARDGCLAKQVRASATRRTFFAMSLADVLTGRRWGKPPEYRQEPAHEWLPRWAQSALSIREEPDWTDPMTLVTSSRHASAAGWPRLALYCTWRYDPAPVSRDGIRIDRHKFLPLRPIWSGLAANTAMFGALWWMVLVSPPAVRRHLRRRQGRCVVCGYDLKGQREAGCPECGEGR
jgi:hypothetical protein